MIDSVVRVQVRQLDPEQTVDTNKLHDVVKVWCRCMEQLSTRLQDITADVRGTALPRLKEKLFPRPRWDIYIAAKNERVVGYIAAEDKLIVNFFVLPEFEELRFEQAMLDHIQLLKGNVTIQLLAGDEHSKQVMEKFGFVPDEYDQQITDFLTGLPVIRFVSS